MESSTPKWNLALQTSKHMLMPLNYKQSLKNQETLGRNWQLNTRSTKSSRSMYQIEKGRPVGGRQPRWTRRVVGGSPTCPHVPTAGKRSRIQDWRLWIMHALSGHQTWWRHSSAADAPPCTGSVTSGSLEMGVSKELTPLLPMNR